MSGCDTQRRLLLRHRVDVGKGSARRADCPLRRIVRLSLGMGELRWIATSYASNHRVLSFFLGGGPCWYRTTIGFLATPPEAM